MTGSLALAMLAAIGLRTLPETERPRRVLRSSPYGVAETVLRIEAAAALQGLAVLVRAEGAEPVIVLASSAGGTPVSMQGGAPDMPLALQVRAVPNGSEVMLGATAQGIERELRSVSAAAADEVAALPQIVAGALA